MNEDKSSVSLRCSNKLRPSYKILIQLLFSINKEINFHSPGFKHTAVNPNLHNALHTHTLGGQHWLLDMEHYTTDFV